MLFFVYFRHFFLTGCAQKGYHNPVQLSGSSYPTSNNSGHGFEPMAQSFIWPVNGRVVVGFGGKEDSVFTKGMVIESHDGDSVVASRDGRVIFVDEKMKGYGRTIIVEHSSEFSTIYARNSEILVSLGEWVKQGQPIARVGHAGLGSFPQLYFELRKRTRPEDPLKYLVR